MEEIKDERLKDKTDELYANIITLKRLGVDNYYCANLLKWFNEVVSKNIAIYQSKKTAGTMDQELYKKPRQNVYWIDFGRNIGSEFHDCHFAVVLYESKYTAIVIPLTSKKEQDPTWIEENKDVIVDLGTIEGYPNENKECYACTFMLQTVSKKRLTKYGKNKGVHYKIKITDEQMKKICDKVSEITYNNITKISIDK
ncbi:MAG: type II toxin-antitoxin system PemK/MazF family toxin [Clostridia bacterium]|nr:type II toxin-antitoxin system PemK/MazF family toxin [Clostridia bacterium]